jgi:hypothetical protein
MRTHKGFESNLVPEKGYFGPMWKQKPVIEKYRYPDFVIRRKNIYYSSSLTKVGEPVIWISVF